jgi:hypothetical protein
MSGSDNRRTEVRLKSLSHVWFNIMEPDQEFIRSRTVSLDHITGGMESAQLEGRDNLERFLIRLEQKLDIVINLLAENVTRKHYEYKAVLVDVSESGLRMISPVTLSPGSRLEIGLVLPNKPYHTIDIAGEIIWDHDGDGVRGEDGVTLGVCFTDILNEDRDDIVHYIFQKQREEIRRMKN